MKLINIGMLTIDECKTILIDDDEYYTDDEVKLIREILIKKSSIVYDAYYSSINKPHGK